MSGSDITALEVKDTEPVACMEPVTPEEYVRIRDEKCAKEGYVHWDVDAVPMRWNSRQAAAAVRRQSAVRIKTHGMSRKMTGIF